MSDVALTLLPAIDAIHAEDPSLCDGRPRELVYAERMTHWLERLDASASVALRIAVRAQHLARWRSPRAAYPEGRAGYLKWRKDANERHASDVRAIVVERAHDEALAARVAALVGKKDRTRDPEAQTLEDCACLVFLELDYTGFVDTHDDDAKVIGIVQKTWAKMSDAGRRLALSVPLHGRPAALIARALGAA